MEVRRVLMNVDPSLENYIKDLRKQLLLIDIDLTQEEITRMLPVIYSYTRPNNKLVIIIKKADGGEGGRRRDTIDDYFYLEDMRI